jgi:hypothetical protein
MSVVSPLIAPAAAAAPSSCGLTALAGLAMRFGVLKYRPRAAGRPRRNVQARVQAYQTDAHAKLAYTEALFSIFVRAPRRIAARGTGLGRFRPRVPTVICLID